MQLSHTFSPTPSRYQSVHSNNDHKHAAQSEASFHVLKPSRALFKKLMGGAVVLAMLTQISACGTLIYPERKGQGGGRLDIGVVALDAIGLLFFFVPGVIAFAVDFATGAIYLPGGNLAQLSVEELERVKNEDGSVNESALKSILDGKLAATKQLQTGALDNSRTNLYTIQVGSEVQLAQLFEDHPTPARLALRQLPAREG